MTEKTNAFNAAVSIHAPTQGATGLNSVKAEYPIVSIHAPTQGATGLNSVKAEYPIVSIHAPTQGATIPGLLD